MRWYVLNVLSMCRVFRGGTDLPPSYRLFSQLVGIRGLTILSGSSHVVDKHC